MAPLLLGVCLTVSTTLVSVLEKCCSSCKMKWNLLYKTLCVVLKSTVWLKENHLRTWGSLTPCPGDRAPASPVCAFRLCMEAASLLAASPACLLRWHESLQDLADLSEGLFIINLYLCEWPCVSLWKKTGVRGQETSAGILHVKKMPCGVQLLFSNLIFFGLSPLVFLIF